MKLIYSKNNKSLIFPSAQSPCSIILINPNGLCIYLLMGFNDYLGPLVNVEGATSISTILLVDVDVKSFSSYKCVPTPWTKYTKTTLRRVPSLGNPSCSKLEFSPPLVVAVTVAAALPSPTILFFMQQVKPTPTQLLLPWPCGGCTGGQKKMR